MGTGFAGYHDRTSRPLVGPNTVGLIATPARRIANKAIVDLMVLVFHG